MIKNIPLGVENYIEANSYFYVDKTLIIKDIIDNCIGRPLLITRPRRFGKSLMISMLEYFFTNKGDYLEYFKDKKILNIDEKYKKYLNQYPVIHLNMKNISAPDYKSMLNQTFDLIASLFRKYPEILEMNTLFDYEKEKYLNFANKKLSDPFSYADAINFLSELLFKKYNKKVVILIDEYDTPLENSYQNNFYEDAIEFFKRFYSATLKANENVLFSLTTGVLQISKESIFSELNHLNVFSVTNDTFVQYFGFTENEVLDIFSHFNMQIDIDIVRKYYGGYGTEECNIYNPWSVLNFVENETFDSYWVNTGSNTTIYNLIENIPDSLTFLNEFINNNNLQFKFDNSITYKDVKMNMESLFSFLVQSGYLVAKKTNKMNLYYLYIPNEELKNVFEREIIARNIDSGIYQLAYKFKNSFLVGNTEEISRILSDFIISSFSYYNLRKENDYQNIITALLAVLFNDYLVKNEVNNAYGRCDIMLSPKNNKNIGMIIEIKKYKGRVGTKRFENYANAAIKQIRDNQYYSELKSIGCKECLLYAFIFDDGNNYIKMEKE